MNKQELIDKLLKCKSHLKITMCDLDDVVSDVMDALCDYNSDNDYELDSYTYTYETSDWVEEFIKYTIENYWILTLKHRLEEVDWDVEYYRIDDVDWTIYTRDYYDVEEWIDDILSELWYEQDETSD